MCCNQKRMALKSNRAHNATTVQVALSNNGLGNARPTAGMQRSQQPVPLFYSSVSLRYVEKSPIRVRGPVTGRQYDFSSTSPVQSVDPRDVTGLLGTQLFRSA